MSYSSDSDHKPLPLKETISALPLERPGIRAQIRSILDEYDPEAPKLVILDDDPTGTQTCHDIAVLTVWDISTLTNEFLGSGVGFFILTNSRAFPPAEVRPLLTEICQNLRTAAAAAGKVFEIVLRGDSTLRGHFPLEPEVVEEVFGKVDAWILAPFFYQGGRYTIDDVHYVLEKDILVPAGQTPFASDASFGYRSSNLRDYIQEKAPEKFKPENIVSITLDDTRRGGSAGVEKKLLSLAPGSIVIVNAAAESDMDIFSAGLLAAESRGRKFLFRTAAAFVSSRLGIIPKSPMSAQDLDFSYGHNVSGGLIIAGSYVPKTTTQLGVLISRRGDKLRVLELSVTALITEGATEDLVCRTADTASAEIIAGHDVLIMTSRELVTGHDALRSLGIGSAVAAALVKIMKRISTRPRYIIAKVRCCLQPNGKLQDRFANKFQGGITSSDVATKALGIKRAMVLGQAAPGVPLWRCDEESSRYPGVPFVVFPGNVGGDDALAEIVESWSLDENYVSV